MHDDFINLHRKKSVLFGEYKWFSFKNFITLHHPLSQNKITLLALSPLQRLRELLCDHLLEEALVDLQEQFNTLLTPRWLNNTEPMDTICLTLSDYFTDYQHLYQKYVWFMMLSHYSFHITCAEFIVLNQFSFHVAHAVS